MSDETQPTAAPVAHPRQDEGGAATEAGSAPPSPRRRGPVQPSEREIGGPKGPEPTRFGDWEKDGRCSDF